MEKASPRHKYNKAGRSKMRKQNEHFPILDSNPFPPIRDSNKIDLTYHMMEDA